MSIIHQAQTPENARPIGSELAPWSMDLLALLEHADQIPFISQDGPPSRTLATFKLGLRFGTTLRATVRPGLAGSTQAHDRLWEQFLHDRQSHAGKIARDQLLMRYRPLVNAVVAGLCRRLHNSRINGQVRKDQNHAASASREDMEQEGFLGLIAALDGFEPRHGVNFGNYARLKIRGAVLDAMRRWRRGVFHAQRHSDIPLQPISYGAPEHLNTVEFNDLLTALTAGMDSRRRLLARLWLHDCMSLVEIARMLQLHVTRVGQIRRDLIVRWRTEAHFNHLLREWIGMKMLSR